MVKANQCKNITDPKARKACLAKAKKAGSGTANAPGFGGAVKWGLGKMMENIPK